MTLSLLSIPTLGKRIMALRGARSQADFAAEIGVTQSTLSKYEFHGMMPNPAVLHRLAAIGGVTMEWLLEGAAMPDAAAAVERANAPLEQPSSPDKPGESLASDEGRVLRLVARTLGSVPGAKAIFLRHLQAALAELQRGREPAGVWPRVVENTSLTGLMLRFPTLLLNPDPATIRFYSVQAKTFFPLYEESGAGLARHFTKMFPAGGRILDVGCGTGYHVAELLRLGYDAYGVDPCPDFLRLAEDAHPQLQGRLAAGALPGLGQPFGGEFDGVLCAGVLQHVPAEQLIPAAAELLNVLKPAGRLMLAVPSRPSAGKRAGEKPLLVTHPPEGLLFLFRCLGCRPPERWQEHKVPERPNIFLFQRVS